MNYRLTKSMVSQMARLDLSKNTIIVDQMPGIMGLSSPYLERVLMAARLSDVRTSIFVPPPINFSYVVILSVACFGGIWKWSDKTKDVL